MIARLSLFFQKKTVTLLLLGFIILCGLFVRLTLAPLPGYGFDVGVNKNWGESALKLGIVDSYRTQLNGNMLPNYPPLSIAIFEGVAVLYQQFVSPTYDTSLPAYQILIKLPAILSDIATLCILTWVVWQYTKKRRFLYLAATLYALSPAVFYDSSVWGQTDSIFTLFVLAAFVTLCTRWKLLAFFLLSLGILTKAQALIFTPLLFFCVLPRLRLTIRGATIMIITGLLAILPFALGGSGMEVIHVYTKSMGYYPTLTSAAYNVWWSLFADQAGSVSDTKVLFGLLSYRHLGLLLFGSLYLGMLLSFRRSLWRTGQQIVFLPITLIVAGLVNYAFFLFTTEMHERYLFPYVALSFPLLLLGRRGSILYFLTSLCFLFNLLGVTPYGSIDKALFNEFPTLDVLIASAQIFLFVLTWMFLLQKQKEILAAVATPVAKKKPARLKKARINDTKK